MEEAIRRCRTAGVRICSGGVIYATPRDDLSPVDHIFLGEVEDTLPQFLADLQAGQPRAVYQAEDFPDLARTPRPEWDLINFSDYLTMALQVTRGCPHDCDFCHVAILNGRQPRSKDAAQVLEEIDGLYQAGWRGPVMFVDDNFIGQKAVARRVLTALADWQIRHSYPFIFLSQASVEVADHPDLLALLQRAGFVQLFLGLETPAAASLAECNKKQNLKRDLVGAVRIIQKYSIDVLGGFIVGFDADPPTIFEEMAEFIEQAALPTAMVGVLAAPPGTRLYARLAAENRLTGQSDGDSIANLSGMNVIPVMGRARLLSGYKRLLTRLYEPERYYRRVADFLSHYCPKPVLAGPSADQNRGPYFPAGGLGPGDQGPGPKVFLGFSGPGAIAVPSDLPSGHSHHSWRISLQNTEQTFRGYASLKAGIPGMLSVRQRKMLLPAENSKNILTRMNTDGHG